MDQAANVAAGDKEEELKHLRYETQRLRAEVERVRRERDDAEARFATSQAKNTELQHQVRVSALRVADLEAERSVLPQMARQLGQPAQFPGAKRPGGKDRRKSSSFSGEKPAFSLPPPLAPITPEHALSTVPQPAQFSDSKTNKAAPERKERRIGSGSAGSQRREKPALLLPPPPLAPIIPPEIVRPEQGEHKSATVAEEKRALSAVPQRPQPPVPPHAPEIIEISDHERGVHERVSRRPYYATGSSSGQAATVPEKKVGTRISQTPSCRRQFMDFVDVPRIRFKSRTSRSLFSETPDSMSGTGQFESSAPVASSSTGSTLVSADWSSHRPSTRRPSSSPPPAKRPRKLKLKEPKQNSVLEPLRTLYLTTIASLAIDPPPASDPALCVARKFLRVHFGGSDQQFLQYFTAVDRDGAQWRRALVFPRADLNPFLPAEPGAAGLIFASRLEITRDPPWALFCKDATNTRNAVWRYMGDYENERCGSLTPMQFRSQEAKVLQAWGELVLKARKVDAYISMRARIALRKAGMTTEPDDVAREVAVVRAVKRTGVNGLPVQPQDVVQALCRGDETVDLIRLKCVSYDHAFEKDMAARLAVWDPSASVGAAGGDQKKSHRAPRKRGKRRDDEWNSDLGSQFSPESEESDSEQATIVRGRKGDRRDSQGGTVPQVVHSQAPNSSYLGSDDSMSDLTDYGY
ncbi:hypothetical protein C8R43DRAFT_1108097 [Mycena crocata]|nr:hypothetical protein C8R43DRAFT_1108097 [Mycena crocata]